MTKNHVTLANIQQLSAQGKYEEATQACLHFLQQHPYDAKAHNKLGALYFSQNAWQAAIDAYQAAIDLQPHYPDAYYNLALTFNKLNRKEEALHAYQALIELAPQHIGGHFQAACLLMQRQDYQAAIIHFLLVEQLDPTHFENQFNLATAYLMIKQWQEAKSHYLQALAIQTNDLQVLFNLGVISMQQGQVREAIAFYSRAIELNPDYHEAHHNLSIAYLEIKDRKKALNHFCEVLRILPNNEAVRHTIHILKNEKNITASPPEYIQTLFDSYADHYDSHLETTLHYEVPRFIAEIVKKNCNLDNIQNVLDLGCGTGLCGVLFKEIAHSLTGVDISAKMLNVAAKKQIYDTLITAELLTFLLQKSSAFDLIIAGDVLVYFGELDAIFAAIDQALRSRSWFVFNTEISINQDYALTQTGRFIHSQDYIQQLADKHHFTIIAQQAIKMRTQERQTVNGFLYLLQKE